MTEHQSSAPEIIPSLPLTGGLPQKPWISERSFLAKKNCKHCGAEFQPRRWTSVTGLVRVAKESAWNKQECCGQSCAKKLKNPMSNHQVRLKVKARLREIKHKPIRRGGNGQLLPVAQLALLHALGEGWESELPVATQGRGGPEGYPTCYKLDIGNMEKKIGIELDGNSHGLLSRQKQDRKKEQFFLERGWQVLRVSNDRALELYSTFVSVDTLLTSLMAC